MKLIPLTKTLLLLLLTTLLLYLNNYVFTVILFVVTLAALLAINNRNFLKKRIVPLCITVFLLICFHAVFNGSVPLAGRLQMGLLAGIRLFCVSSLVLLYTTTTSPLEIISVVSFLPNIARLLLTITLTTVPAIFEESEHIWRVQKSRGLCSSRLSPFSSLLPIVLPLFHSIFIRAEQLTIVMMSRGYSSS
jgi:energy-coupling factor transporter transmembrane protein EcfT